MRWIWIAAAILTGVAAFSVWFAFQRPDFVAGLVAIAAAAAWKAFGPVLLKSSPETQARAKQDARDGTRRTITGREREH